MSDDNPHPESPKPEPEPMQMDSTAVQDRFTLLQQKHVELIAHFQKAQQDLALQHLGQLSYYQALQQANSRAFGGQKPPESPAGSSAPTTVPSSFDVDDAEMQQNSPTSSGSTKELSGARNRRSYSGSAQTISQLTRDRLKSMIETKKRSRTESSGNLGSGNLASGNSPPVSSMSQGKLWSPPVSAAAKSWTQSSSAVSSPTVAGAMPPALSASGHFEPYTIPQGVGALATPHSPQYQLRKVNSEPNLKMRIRAKLLSKGSSPVQQGPQPASASTTPSSAFAYPHPTLQRCDSDSASIEAFLSSPQAAAARPNRVDSAAVPFHLMLPSPSLPNLTNVGGCGPFPMEMSMSALMSQAQLAPFLSMPSLFKNAAVDSLLDPAREGSSGRQAVKFDTRTLSSPLPLGGHPSLLKQQLRDLVLRRKSLVREEPEEDPDVLMDTTPGTRNPSTLPKTGLAYDTGMSKHQCICGENQRNHVEHGGRVQSIWMRLQERGLVEKCDRMPVKKAPLDVLRTCHSATYVTFFAVSPTACLKVDPSQLPLKSFVQLPCGGIGVDSDTYFNDATTQVATRLAVGCLMELSSQVVEGKVRNGFACIRPPGHHAERDQSMGFCFFNNVAITARFLQARYPQQCARIAIVDWDVHHGNGTQLCFEDDPSVLYVSLHRHDNGNFFPGTGAVTEVGSGAGKGFTVNIPFSGEPMGDADYLAAWRVIVGPVLEFYKPQLVLVSAGFDAARGHPSALGGYHLSPQLFGYFTRQLMNFAEGKVVLALEGGYDLPSICDSAEECVKALCQSTNDAMVQLSEEALSAVPQQSCQETIQKVVAIHKKHWPCLTGLQGINSSELQWQTLSQRFTGLSVQP
uniref:histone deacetylase n=1 Tax=Steinernema glaseri TaxID=37863 RepID=A0A1I7ZWF0_9BILA